MPQSTETPYKLIALDMDGTLLNNRKQLSDNNKKWVRAAAESGMVIVLATSRPIQDVLAHANTLQLDTPLIVCNGSEVWSSPDSLHSRKQMEAKAMEQVFSLLQKYDSINYWAQYVGGQLDHRMPVPENILSMKWLQIAVQTGNAVHLQDIYNELSSWNVFEISNSHISNIECNPSGRNKASGLQEVCSLLGIDMTEVMAFGDSLNDLSMIRAAGIGFAMGNAQEKLKQAADVIAPSNEKDGVAAMIRQYLFGHVR